MVQEELAMHNEEGEVVQRPAHDKKADEVVVLHCRGWRGYEQLRTKDNEYLLWWKSL